MFVSERHNKAEATWAALVRISCAGSFIAKLCYACYDATTGEAVVHSLGGPSPARLARGLFVTFSTRLRGMHEPLPHVYNEQAS